MQPYFLWPPSGPETSPPACSAAISPGWLLCDVHAREPAASRAYKFLDDADAICLDVQRLCRSPDLVGGGRLAAGEIAFWPSGIGGLRRRSRTSHNNKKKIRLCIEERPAPHSPSTCAGYYDPSSDGRIASRRPMRACACISLPPLSPSTSTRRLRAKVTGTNTECDRRRGREGERGNEREEEKVCLQARTHARTQARTGESPGKASAKKTDGRYRVQYYTLHLPCGSLASNPHTSWPLSVTSAGSQSALFEIPHRRLSMGQWAPATSGEARE